MLSEKTVQSMQTTAEEKGQPHPGELYNEGMRCALCAIDAGPHAAANGLAAVPPCRDWTPSAMDISEIEHDVGAPLDRSQIRTVERGYTQMSRCVYRALQRTSVSDVVDVLADYDLYSDSPQEIFSEMEALGV